MKAWALTRQRNFVGMDDEDAISFKEVKGIVGCSVTVQEVCRARALRSSFTEAVIISSPSCWVKLGVSCLCSTLVSGSSSSRCLSAVNLGSFGPSLWTPRPRLVPWCIVRVTAFVLEACQETESQIQQAATDSVLNVSSLEKASLNVLSAKVANWRKIYCSLHQY